MFDEGKRLILPLVGGTMKKYRLGPAALVDEVIIFHPFSEILHFLKQTCVFIGLSLQVFLFRRTITLEKENIAPPRNISSPLLDNEDSMDAPR